MTLYEYKLLPDAEQYEVLFNQGDFVTSRISGTKRYALYSLFLFFLEVEYNSAENKIVKKVSFVRGEKLDVYSNFKANDFNN